MTQPARKPLSKRIRFEVFKRDSFKCQYCGALGSSEGVVLHVDHIKPVAEGGTDHITNLITACSDCNLGKSAVPLSESAAASKAHAQLEELQARREQLEMMVEWQRGLAELDNERVEQVASMWPVLCPGWRLNDSGKAGIRKHLKKYSAEEVIEGMREAAHAYGNDGFNRLGGILRVQRLSKEKPYIRNLYYIRGILRRLHGERRDDYLAIECMERVHLLGITIDVLSATAKASNSWSNFYALIEGAERWAKANLYPTARKHKPEPPPPQDADGPLEDYLDWASNPTPYVAISPCTVERDIEVPEEFAYTDTPAVDIRTEVERAQEQAFNEWLESFRMDDVMATMDEPEEGAWLS